MEIYKGTATFSGIAIGKILYYSRGEYQIRQCLVSNIKKEISNFQEARLQAVQKLHELYEANRPVFFFARLNFWNPKVTRMQLKAALPMKR